MRDTKVYFIVNLKIHDSEVYRIYEKGFFPILKKYDGEFITFDDNPKHVEGDNPIEQDRMIMFSFPSSEKADAWWADPDYQELSENRRASTSITLTRINGLPPRV